MMHLHLVMLFSILIITTWLFQMDRHLLEPQSLEILKDKRKLITDHSLIRDF